MTDNQKFAVYVIVWGILAVIFTILKKKEKRINKQKAITLVGSILILALVFGVALWLGLPWIPLSFLAILSIGLVYVGRKYTYYCESCGSSQQQLLSRVEFCPKCGKKY